MKLYLVRRIRTAPKMDRNNQREVDPEYITGYNIFGFDFAYMTDRINVYDKPYRYKFMNMGKINSNNKVVYKNHRSKKCCERK